MRTKDKSYLECPICKKRPYVSIYGINSGQAYCRGRIFNGHELLLAAVKYESPSKLTRSIINKWNSIVLNTEENNNE